MFFLTGAVAIGTKQPMSYFRAFAFLAVIGWLPFSWGCGESPRAVCLAQYRGNYREYLEGKTETAGLHCPPIPPSEFPHDVSYATGLGADSSGEGHSHGHGTGH